MTIVEFGYDKQAGVHQRGLVRVDASGEDDWTLMALDLTFYGEGWEMCNWYGSRWSRGITRSEAEAQLLEARLPYCKQM